MSVYVHLCICCPLSCWWPLLLWGVWVTPFNKKALWDFVPWLISRMILLLRRLHSDKVVSWILPTQREFTPFYKCSCVFAQPCGSVLTFALVIIATRRLWLAGVNCLTFLNLVSELPDVKRTILLSGCLQKDLNMHRCTLCDPHS